MSEKRFKLKENLEDVLIEDTITQSQYSIYGIVDVLNEQDDELHKYRTENAELHITILENEKENIEQQATIKKQDIEIQSLNLHIEKLVDGDEISQLLMREYERSDDSEKENKELKQELREMDKLLKSYRETIKHDAELLADATRNGYLPPLDDFVKE